VSNRVKLACKKVQKAKSPAQNPFAINTSVQSSRARGLQRAGGLLTCGKRAADRFVAGVGEGVVWWC